MQVIGLSLTFSSPPTLNGETETGEHVDVPNRNFNPNRFYTGNVLVYLSFIPFIIMIFLDKRTKEDNSKTDETH